MAVQTAETNTEGKVGSSPSVGTHSSSLNGLSDNAMTPLGKASAEMQAAVSIGIAEEASDFMESVPLSRQLTVEFAEVSVWVPKMQLGNPNPLIKSRTLARSFVARVGQGKGDAASSTKSDTRQVLYNISGTCQAGEMLALMGPSGSGKTTLLSVLGGRSSKGINVQGQATYNGLRLTKQIKRRVGFVLQDDLLYATLTVYETLYFAAMLRLPRSMTKEQKIARVEAVIDTLGLRKCKDTIIGGFLRRGVSGGERKRVSVGHELLINPSVMMLDEPTSGLDSTTAMRLITTLHQLAMGGRSIVMTIHQPSSRLYQQLDKLLLLSEGHAMYYGQASAAPEWFRRLGFTMPYGVNAADFILDLASADVRTDKLEGEEAREHLIECQEAYASTRRAEGGYDGYNGGHELNESVLGSQLWGLGRARTNGTYRTSTDDPKSGEPWPPSDAGPVTTAQRQEPKEEPEEDKDAQHRWGAPYLLQLQILFLRAVKVRRFETLSTQDTAQFAIMGLICGLFWWQVARGDTLLAASNTNGLLFFEMLFLGLRAMFSALFTFPNEFKMMLKERASGMYRLSAFYFARTFSDLPMEFTLPSFYIIIMYFMSGLRLTPGAFFSNWASVMLVSAVSQSFGLLIGATVMVPKTAMTITSVTMLSMMLVGGFYVNLIPVWIAWGKYISFLFYGYNLLLKIEYRGRTIWDCHGTNPPHPETTKGCIPIPADGLKQALRLQTNPDQWPWEALALLTWLIVFRILVYIALRYKTSATKP